MLLFQTPNFLNIYAPGIRHPCSEYQAFVSQKCTPERQILEKY